jgi:putative PIN family toxin of toxin-antitoxin system
MVVVFDTNVLIPLALPASRSTVLMGRLRAAGWPVAASPQIIDEVSEKLRTKQSVRDWLRMADADLEQFILDLPTQLVVTPGLVSAAGGCPADPDDDIVIAAAVEAGAAYIITEDRHLLELGVYQGIRILDRLQFAAELDRLGVP